MIEAIIPKLPMRNKAVTKEYYQRLGFHEFGIASFDDYLMVEMEKFQIHFFLFKELDPKENYGQIYIRANEIDELHNSFIAREIQIHPNGGIQNKPWGQREFALLDPDNNLLTFGQSW